MLKLKDAYARVEQAKKQESKLKLAFNEWVTDKGVEFVDEKDPVYARYGYFAVMHKEPIENLAILAGEIFNNLRSALNYVAFQIYLAGGGDPQAKMAKAVAFPIVREQEKWSNGIFQGG